MVIKKSLMIAGAVATIGLAGATYGPGLASAEETGDTSSKTGMSSLVDKIATKFNLNKDEVQAVFDEEHDAREAEHKSRIEEKLTQAVKDGEITEEQKSKILAKMEELKKNRPDKSELEDKSPEEIKALMEQRRTELEKWAEENNIPKEYLHIAGAGGPKFHMRMEKGDEQPLDVKSEL